MHFRYAFIKDAIILRIVTYLSNSQRKGAIINIFDLEMFRENASLPE